MNTYIGLQLRRYRELLGLSMRDLASALSVSSREVEQFELGIERINAEQLLRAAQYLGAPIGAFFEGLTTGPDILLSSPLPPPAPQLQFHGTPETGTVTPNPEANAEALELVRAFGRITQSPHRKDALDLLRGVENLLQGLGTRES